MRQRGGTGWRRLSCGDEERKFELRIANAELRKETGSQFLNSEFAIRNSNFVPGCEIDSHAVNAILGRLFMLSGLTILPTRLSSGLFRGHVRSRGRLLGRGGGIPLAGWLAAQLPRRRCATRP